MTHLVLILGVALIALGAGRMIPYLRARNWVSGTARVLSIVELWSEVWLTYNVRMKYYFPQIQYEYQSQVGAHKSNRVSFEKQNVWVPEVDGWGNPTDKTKNFWAGWSKDSTIPIYVNPSNPMESVIIRALNKKRRSHHLAFIAGGTILILVWVLLLIAI